MRLLKSLKILKNLGTPNIIPIDPIIVPIDHDIIPWVQNCSLTRSGSIVYGYRIITPTPKVENTKIPTQNDRFPCIGNFVRLPYNVFPRNNKTITKYRT